MIDPLLSSSSLFDFYLPSGFLLAGHKEITSEFVSGIKHEISDSVNIKDFSNLDINNKFNDNIIKLLQNAREFFLETGKRKSIRIICQYLLQVILVINQK